MTRPVGRLGASWLRAAMLACLYLPLGLPSGLAAQEPVRAYLMGDPLPGHEAPAFSLLYATADGPGPQEQPFVLRAELGRVVVLAFAPGTTDSGALRLLRTFSERYDEWFAGEVVVAGVLQDPLPQLATWAEANRLRGKLLADSAHRVRRMFGVDQRATGVYVIGLDGRIVWRDLRFDPSSASSYAQVREAVRRALRGG